MPRRREKAPEPPKQFKYQSVAECEENEDHIVHPTVWPPRKLNRDDENPSVALPCTLCNGWCVVYADNDPELSGTIVIVPQKKKAATA